MLHRRSFLVTTAAALFTPLSLRAAGLPYTPGLVDDRLAAGETVFVDFYAEWCSTCRAQSRVIDSLLEARPDYAAAMTFIRVDWDTYQNDPLTLRLQVPRRSTLAVLKGDERLGMIVAGTSQRDIQALMEIGLAAATA